MQKRVNEKLGTFVLLAHLVTLTGSHISGVKESDTGLAAPNLWDLPADRQRMQEEHPLQVARCTKIITMDPEKAAHARALNPAGALQGQKGADEQDKYVINIKQIAKFVVGLGDRVAPTDIEEGMRVGYVHAYSYWAYYSLQAQRGPDEVPNSDTPSTQDRRLRDHDASRGKTGCDLLRRWGL